MTAIDKYILSLSESYHSSTIKRGRPQKLESTAGTLAISMARQNKDPLYDRMIKFKKMYKATKTQIERKYRSKAIAKARSLASK